MEKHKLIFLGPLPPPVMGPSLATEIILNSKLNDHFHIIHCDTSDHRELATLGRIDLMNFILAFRHYLKLVYLIIQHWPKLVYIPISQTTMGYFRDAGFIIIAKLFRRKVICHLRGGNFYNWLTMSCPLTRWLVVRIHKRVDGQIVLGENLRLLFAGILPSDRIHVVPNGGNYNVPNRKSSKSVVKIVFLSNLLPEKGFLDSVKAVAILSTLPIRTLYRLDVYGGWQDTKTKASALQLVHYQNLPVSFHSAPGKEAKMELLANADIFVFPSYYPPEGHPWVIVEAMAAGLPIISTDQGAIAESVLDGVNGFIVEKRNPEAIAEKLKKLIEEPLLREKMGRESRRLYEEKYTEENMVANLTYCFNRVFNVYEIERWYSGMSKEWWKNYSFGDRNFLRRLNIVHLLLDKQQKISKVLDIGCGTGEITVSVGERFKTETTGMDISDKMIAHCRENSKNHKMSFLVGDILDLQFPDGTFDLVMAISVIEWLADYEQAIKEVSRVLQPGGQWIVSLPNWRSPFRKLEYFCSLFSNKSYLKYQKNRVSLNQFVQKAREFGMVLDKSEYHVLPFIDIQFKEKFGSWLNMMCIMSFKKNGEQHETIDAKT